MAINITGLIVLAVFYLIILVIGIWVGRKSAKAKSADEVFIANRNMGLVVSLFSLTATNVGGAYINGTSEIVASSGVLWAQAPVGFCIGLFIGGWFYGPKMRKAGYVTMYDPFQEKYGARVGAVMCVPEFVGDIFWTAAILSALGSTMSIIMELDKTTSILVSAGIAAVYTFFGGLWSVAYTDVIQLCFIAIGLVLAFPFAMAHPAVDREAMGTQWSGEVPTWKLGSFLDVYGLLIMGGIPWQPFYQRVLACKTPHIAKVSLMISSVLCLLFAVPPAILGIAGAATDWNQTGYPGEVPLPPEQLPFMLPLTLQYLCPAPVSIIGLAAISAASMSSVDSTTLSVGSIFTNNCYKGLIRPKAGDREMIWVLRITVLLAAILGSVLAITSKTVYGLYVMSGDLMYVILFPQLTCVLFLHSTNAYGSVCGFIVAVLLRLLSGDSLTGLPAAIHFPLYDEVEGQMFPFRTSIMVLSFSTIVCVSMLTNAAFQRQWLSSKYDVFGYFTTEATERRKYLKHLNLTDIYNREALPNIESSEKATSNGVLEEKNCDQMSNNGHLVPSTESEHILLHVVTKEQTESLLERKIHTNSIT